MPSEIEVESQRLYEEDAIWQDIVGNLSKTRIEEEVFIRETVEQFADRDESDVDTEDLSMYALKPYCHVKIYSVSGDVDLAREPAIPSSGQIIWHRIGKALPSTVFIVRIVSRPKWTTLDAFASVNYHLFVVFYDKRSKLLFINSSLKQAEVYETLAESFTTGSARILPLSQVNRVLVDLENPEFFNIGMRNRIYGANSESYRIIAGSAAQRAISKTDGEMYHRGHVFGRAKDGDSFITIGFSSSSKVWSSSSFLIPKLIEWCQKLAARLSSNKTVITHSPLDNLGVGVVVSEVPGGIVGGEWDIDVFRNPPTISYRNAAGEIRERCLIDLDIVIDVDDCPKDAIRLSLIGPDLRLGLQYTLNADRRFAPLDEPQHSSVSVERQYGDITICDYLNSNPITFFFSDFSCLMGCELFAYQCKPGLPLEDDQVKMIDWEQASVDIRVEYGASSSSQASIHDYVRRVLLNESDVVFYDHGSGEVADFVAFQAAGDVLEIGFYHCKASAEPKPAERVEDMYEICGQVVRSVRWIENDEKLFSQIERRRRECGSDYIKGDKQKLTEILEMARNYVPCYKVVLVQPGISAASVKRNRDLLAAASDYVTKARGQRMELWCSK